MESLSSFDGSDLGMPVNDRACHEEPVIPIEEHDATPESQEASISEALQRCLSCIWSKQAAIEEPVAATVDTIAACSGYSSTALQRELEHSGERYRVKQVVPQSDEHGNHAQSMAAFAPSSPFVTLRQPETCRSTLYPDVPAEHLEPVVFKGLPHFEKTNFGDNQVTHAIHEASKSKRPLLSKEQEHALGDVIQSPESSEAARHEAIEALVENNVKLAIWFAVNKCNFESIFLSFEERVQAALLGIEAAAKHYDPSFDTRFNGYAVIWMKQRVQRTAAARVDVPVHKFTRIPTSYRKALDFEAQHNRPPTVLELAFACNTTPKRIHEVIAVRDLLNQHPISLDVSVVAPDPNGPLLHDRIGAYQGDFENIEVLEAIKKMVPHLNGYEGAVLGNKLGYHKLPRQKIEKMFNVTARTVYKGEARILSLLRHPYFGVGADRSSHEWQLDAACARKNVDSVIEREQSQEVTPEIALLCGRCPVRKECFTETLRGDEPVTAGIWAGFTARELRKYHKRSRSTRVTKKLAPETSMAQS